MVLRGLVAVGNCVGDAEGGGGGGGRGVEHVDHVFRLQDVEIVEQFAGDGALRGAPPGQAGTLAKPVWWQRVLDVESPAGVAWVAFGLLGQGAFMLRMLVQWWASEHEGRSVVPVGFWWISIAGATMLLTYFVWRGDPVGIVGQSMGFLVYARNLWLIHRGDRPAVAG